MKKKRILVPVGLLFLLLGMAGPLIGSLGSVATASVTGSKKAVSSHTKAVSTLHKYRIHYSFQAANGQTYTGSYTLNKVRDPADLPQPGTTLEIRYVSAWPKISLAGPDMPPGLLIVVMSGVGLLLLWFGFFGPEPREKKS